jgi:hypothetical protein
LQYLLEHNLPLDGPSPTNKKAKLYKTELCRSFPFSFPSCSFGEKTDESEYIKALGRRTGTPRQPRNVASMVTNASTLTARRSYGPSRDTPRLAAGHVRKGEGNVTDIHSLPFVSSTRRRSVRRSGYLASAPTAEDAASSMTTSPLGDSLSSVGTSLTHFNSAHSFLTRISPIIQVISAPRRRSAPSSRRG